MGIVIDLIVLAIFIFSVIMGYKKGLVNVIFNVFAFVLALIITFVLYKPITNLVINNTQIDESITQTIIDKGTINIDETKQEGNFEAYIGNYAIETANNTVESLAKTIAQNAVSVIVMIALFAISRIIVILLKFLFNSIAELPLIKQFNKAGGLVYGILRGIIIIYVILAVMFFIVSVNNNVTITNMINSSIITKILYTNNIIVNIIFK